MLRAPGNGSCVQTALNASTLIKGHMIVDKPKGYMGDDSLRLQAEGFRNDAAVSSHGF
jgi:hypothetical protein